MLFNLLTITKEQTFYGSLITLIAYVYGLVSTPLFWILIIFSIIDFCLGVYAAWKSKELNWDKCLDGITKKVFIGILVMVSALVDFTLMFYGINTAGLFHNFIMGALITRELGSFIKNAEKCNFWIPQLIKEWRTKINEFIGNKDEEEN